MGHNGAVKRSDPIGRNKNVIIREDDQGSPCGSYPGISGIRKALAGFQKAPYAAIRSLKRLHEIPRTICRVVVYDNYLNLKAACNSCTNAGQGVAQHISPVISTDNNRYIH
jgi:hypothetical protein